jgi:hypothetical protein
MAPEDKARVAGLMVQEMEKLARQIDPDSAIVETLPSILDNPGYLRVCAQRARIRFAAGETPPPISASTKVALAKARRSRTQENYGQDASSGIG